jgi:hypothetical protein
MNVKIIERKETYKVKDKNIEFLERIKINIDTGEEIYDPDLEQENDIRLYNEYKKIKNLTNKLK